MNTREFFRPGFPDYSQQEKVCRYSPVPLALPSIGVVQIRAADKGDLVNHANSNTEEKQNLTNWPSTFTYRSKSIIFNSVAEKVIKTHQKNPPKKQQPHNKQQQKQANKPKQDPQTNKNTQQKRNKQPPEHHHHQ